VIQAVIDANGLVIGIDPLSVGLSHQPVPVGDSQLSPLLETPVAPRVPSGCWSPRDFIHLRIVVLRLLDVLATLSSLHFRQCPLSDAIHMHGRVPLTGVGFGSGATWLSRTLPVLEFSGLSLIGGAVDPSIVPSLRPDGTIVSRGGVPVKQPVVLFCTVMSDSHLSHRVNVSASVLANSTVRRGCLPMPLTAATCLKLLPYLGPGACATLETKFGDETGPSTNRHVMTTASQQDIEAVAGSVVRDYVADALFVALDRHPCLSDSVSVGVPFPDAPATESLVTACISNAIRRMIARLRDDGNLICGDCATEVGQAFREIVQRS
jgi:hypothetical protein